MLHGRQPFVENKDLQRELLRQRHRLTGNTPDDFSLRNLTEILQAQEAASKVMAILLAAVASVSLLVGGIARSLGTSSGLLRGLFLVFFFGVGGLTFGISSGATLVIYLIFWFTLGKS